MSCGGRTAAAPPTPALTVGITGAMAGGGTGTVELLRTTLFISPGFAR